MDKKVLIVIPARLNSTRFPEKLLHKIGKKSLIQHVYENAITSKLADNVVVATDSEKIKGHLERINAHVMLTSPDHENGTDRLIEVYRKLDTYDLYVNLQGDEPMILGSHLDRYIEQFASNSADIYSLMNPINIEEAHDPNNVKVVVNHKNIALYFSRSLIPYPRNENKTYFKHVGLYAFTHDALRVVDKLCAVQIEKTESLEQLRWLYNDMDIHMTLTSHQYHGVDHPSDVERVEKLIAESKI